MTKSYDNNKEESVRKKWWYIESGCSKHMMGDVSKFTSISPRKVDMVHTATTISVKSQKR